ALLGRFRHPTLWPARRGAARPADRDQPGALHGRAADRPRSRPAAPDRRHDRPDGRPGQRGTRQPRGRCAMTALAGFDAPRVRDSADADLPAIQAIYAHHVRHGTGSFELEPPELAEMAARRQVVVDRSLPYLVAELRGRVAGYA